jgi:hypothetical protein
MIMADEFILDENFILNGQVVGDVHNACNIVLKELRGRLKNRSEIIANLNQQRDALLKQSDELSEKLRKKDILEAACAGFRKVLSEYVKLQTENNCDKADCAVCVQHRKESVAAAMKALEVPVGHHMLNVFIAAQRFVMRVDMAHQNSDGDDTCLSCGGLYRDNGLRHESDCLFRMLENAVHGKDSSEVKEEEVPF